MVGNGLGLGLDCLFSVWRLVCLVWSVLCVLFFMVWLGLLLGILRDVVLGVCRVDGHSKRVVVVSAFASSWLCGFVCNWGFKIGGGGGGEVMFLGWTLIDGGRADVEVECVGLGRMNSE